MKRVIGQRQGAFRWGWEERRVEEGEKQGGEEWLKKKGGVKVAEVSRFVSSGETS